MRTSNLLKYLYGLLCFICVVCLFPLFPTAAQGQQTLALSGTWNFNSFVSGGPSSPWWERGTLTITAPNETFTGSGMDINGNSYSLAGSFSVASNGIVMTLNSPSQTSLCQIDSSNTFMACTQTWSDGSSNLIILSSQPSSSYSFQDLAGAWQGNVLYAGTDSSFETVTETINSDGTFTGTYTKSDGTSGSLSGTLSISSEGTITCSGDCVDSTNYLAVLTPGETVMVATSGSSTTDAGLHVYTKQNTSVSTTTLAGTWQGDGLASGPGAPWWDEDTLIINQNGTSSFAWIASNGTSGSTSGNVSVASGGTITLGLGSTSIVGTASGVIDANTTVMVFTNTWSDGKTHEIRIFTNGTAAFEPSVSAYVSSSVPATSGDSLAATNSSLGTGGSTSPSSNTGAPTGTAFSNAGGGTAAQPGGNATGAGPANTTAAAATNSAGTNTAPPSPSNNPTPATVPDAPEIVVATPRFSEASVSFKLPANGGNTITGCTVTSSPGGITATGSGSPIVVSNLANGIPYTFTVTAKNKIGTGPPSDASNSVTPARTVPDAPAIAKAKADDTMAHISFMAPVSNGGSDITLYTVTSSAGQTASGPASPITVKGLTNGKHYTFTVTAANGIGTGPPSRVSNSVTPATIPGAPAIVKAKAAGSMANVSFKAPASNGGSRITSYTVTSSGGQTASGPASPITVKGLTGGTPYTFTVTATNKIGTGPPSASSNSVVPRKLEKKEH